MPRIAVVVHEQDDFGAPYFLRDIAREWPSTFSVAVQRGLQSPIDADLAILHVDLSVVPAGYRALAERYPKALNARLTDISKRAVSRQLVHRGDGHAGPVIVKTNYNWGGVRELALEHGPRLDPALIRQRLDYRVYANVELVPAALWEDPVWIVERFLPEQREGLYCLRTFLCFGDRETSSLSYSAEPIVKSHNVVKREAAPVPDELRRIRVELGVDYGKFDYVLSPEGKVVLYDVNKTPSQGAFANEKVRPLIHELASGIHAYFRS